ncbi:hypothetical protein GCM10029964_033510 [Kibdelosporangium lantanae]
MFPGGRRHGPTDARSAGGPGGPGGEPGHPDAWVRAEALLRQDVPEPLRRERYARMVAESETHVPSLRAVLALGSYS